MIIQCCKIQQGYMAWIVGLAATHAAQGATAAEAVGNLMISYPVTFGVVQFNLPENHDEDTTRSTRRDSAIS